MMRALLLILSLGGLVACLLVIFGAGAGIVAVLFGGATTPYSQPLLVLLSIAVIGGAGSVICLSLCAWLLR